MKISVEITDVAPPLFLSLQEAVSFGTDEVGELLVQNDRVRISLKEFAPGCVAALQRLVSSGVYEDELSARVVQADDRQDLACFDKCLQRLTQQRLLVRSARVNGVMLASAVPISRWFAWNSRCIARDRRYVLSRFAFCRTEQGQMVLESPLAYARIVLHDWCAAAIVHGLAQPVTSADLSSRLAGVSVEAVESVMTLLVNTDMIEDVNDAGICGEQENPALVSWEFHDLLFHSRSRFGRHDNPFGDTRRFVGRLEPPPARKPTRAYETIVSLPRPDLDRIMRRDRPYARVQEERRSIRNYGDTPMTVGQLSEFLYRVARAKKSKSSPVGQDYLEYVSRPYPSGGGLYELELYVAVNACRGIEPGLYYYDVQKHCLGRICDRNAEVESLLLNASRAAHIPQECLQVMLIVASRFQRVAWKYESMAYALVLKNFGVLCQTMYLAATVMGLAPCALGCGDSDLFARVAGTDYYAETSIGEFLLGSKPRGTKRKLRRLDQMLFGGWLRKTWRSLCKKSVPSGGSEGSTSAAEEPE